MFHFLAALCYTVSRLCLEAEGNRVKKGFILICMLLLLLGCKKDVKEEEILQDNQYYLVAADAKKLLVTLPESFFSDEEEKEVSVLKAFYQKSSTKPLNLYYFKESDDYSVEDIETKMRGFTKEYKDLVSSNEGEILSETDKTRIHAGSMEGYYVDVSYSLGSSESYCAEFYLQNDGYVMHGTIRLDGDDTENVQITELIQSLFENVEK